MKLLKVFLFVFIVKVFLSHFIWIYIKYRPPISRDQNLKYILLWTNPRTQLSRALGTGQGKFLRHNCPIHNCYVTSNKHFFGNLTDFDVILFNGPDISNTHIYLPDTRLARQIYVYANIEPYAYYTIKDERYDNFFNWTWTYKLNSDIYFGYILIKNRHGKIIGPKKDMHWLKTEEMDAVDDDFKQKLRRKKTLAAWFVSNCRALSKREKYVDKMLNKLSLYNNSDMTIDVYGKCGDKTCPLKTKDRCMRMINESYYFYLSFENSLCEDYVTEKLLTALQNNAVPVVFGGANYTRFMPDGAYLNARKFPAKQLVQQMLDIVNNKEKYYDFFRWKKYYSYHDPSDGPETNGFCKLCSKINEKKPNNVKISFYRMFRQWWNK